MSSKISTLGVNNYVLLLLIPVFLVAYPLLTVPGIDALNGSLFQNGRKVVETVKNNNNGRKESALVAAENDDIDASNNSLRVSLGNNERGGWINNVQY